MVLPILELVLFELLFLFFLLVLRKLVLPLQFLDVYSRLFSGGVLRDSRWSSMRNAIVPFYQPTHLANLVPTMQSFVESATRSLSGEEEVNFSHLSLKMAIDIVGKTAFGFDFGLSRDAPSGGAGGGADEASSFLKQHIYSTESLKMDLSGSFSTILGLVAPLFQPLFRWLLGKVPWTTDYQMRCTTEKLIEVIRQVVEKRSGDGGGASPDFLAAILRARKESPAAAPARELFSWDYVSALAFEHLIAGSATTSFTLSSVVYLVSKHREVERKLLAEIDAFAALGRSPTADDLSCMFPYLDQACLSEISLSYNLCQDEFYVDIQYIKFGK